MDLHCFGKLVTDGATVQLTVRQAEAAVVGAVDFLRACPRRGTVTRTGPRAPTLDARNLWDTLSTLAIKRLGKKKNCSKKGKHAEKDDTKEAEDVDNEEEP